MSLVACAENEWRKQEKQSILVKKRVICFQPGLVYSKTPADAANKWGPSFSSATYSVYPSATRWQTVRVCHNDEINNKPLLSNFRLHNVLIYRDHNSSNNNNNCYYYYNYYSSDRTWEFTNKLIWEKHMRDIL